MRSIANSRSRWATVIENVLKMMNAPTKTAITPNASRAGVEEAVDLVVDVTRGVGRVLDAGLDLDPRRADGRSHPVGELLLRDAADRRDADLAQLTLLAEPLLDRRERARS